MIEQRGAHRAKLGDKNRKAVRDWFTMNPTKTMKRCQDDLGLSHMTVRKYHVEMRQEMIDKIKNTVE